MEKDQVKEQQDKQPQLEKSEAMLCDYCPFKHAEERQKQAEQCTTKEISEKATEKENE